MDLLDLLKLGSFDIWNSLVHGDIKPIDAKRWSVSVDDEPFGSVITRHTVGVDDTGAWAKWEYEYDDDQDPDTVKVTGTVQSWITASKRHVIKVNGKDVEKDSVRVRVTTVGFLPPKGVLIVLHRFVDGNGDARLIRFDGRL